MSTCISLAGEYGEHKQSDQEFVCGRCFAFDEDAAVAEVDALRAQLDAVRKYANERAWYGRTNRTVGSARIASDLFAILGKDDH